MKKIIGIIILILLIIVSITTYNLINNKEETKEVKQELKKEKNKAVLTDKKYSNITPKETTEFDYTFDYIYDKEEDKDKTIVYVFYGGGCPKCDSLFDKLDSDTIMKTKFVARMYEVWDNEDNAKLMEKVAKYNNEKLEGVPYIIIGNKTWMGFKESYYEEIKDEILNKPKYDISKEVNF